MKVNVVSATGEVTEANLVPDHSHVKTQAELQAEQQEKYDESLKAKIAAASPDSE